MNLSTHRRREQVAMLGKNQIDRGEFVSRVLHVKDPEPAVLVAARPRSDDSEPALRIVERRAQRLHVVADLPASHPCGLRELEPPVLGAADPQRKPEAVIHELEYRIDAVVGEVGSLPEGLPRFALKTDEGCPRG